MDLILNIIIRPAFAAGPTPIPIGFIGALFGDKSLGPFGDFANRMVREMYSNQVTAETIVGNELNAVVSIFIGFLTTIAALWFIIRIILGGIGWISSGGDQKSLQNAQQTITNAIIGLTIVIASYAIISVVGALLGINILNPAKMLNLIP